jgi:hypothetical protein
MDDLLGALMEGVNAEPDGSQSEVDPHTDLLIGLLEDSNSEGTGDMGDLLAGLLSSEGPQGAAGTGDIASVPPGGGEAPLEADPYLESIVNSVTEGLGLSPETAQAVVSFVMDKLMSGRLGSSSALDVGSRDPGSAMQEGLDLDDLAKQMTSDQGLDAAYLDATGMTEELSRQTGLDRDTTAASLREVFGLLGGGLGEER